MEQSLHCERKRLWSQARIFMNFCRKENNQGALFPLAMNLPTGSRLNVEFSARGRAMKAVESAPGWLGGVFCLHDCHESVSIKRHCTQCQAGGHLKSDGSEVTWQDKVLVKISWSFIWPRILHVASVDVNVFLVFYFLSKWQKFQLVVELKQNVRCISWINVLGSSQVGLDPSTEYGDLSLLAQFLSGLPSFSHSAWWQEGCLQPQAYHCGQVDAMLWLDRWESHAHYWSWR